MADKIDKTVAQYKEFQQLQEFAQAQQTTIIQLSKKIQRLDEEKDHLKKLLESSVPLLKVDGNEASPLLTSSEENICIMQLDKLRNISVERELTLEEARRVEIFSKILATFRNAPKTFDGKSKQMKTEELLALVDNSDGK